MAGRRPPRLAGEGLLRPTPRPKGVLALDDMIAALVELDANGLCLQWRNHLGGTPPAHLPRWLLMKILAYRIQATAFGGLDKETLRVLRQPKGRRLASSDLHPFEARIATTREGTKLKAGSLLAREWNGRLERVMILDQGVAWNGETYGKPIASRQGDDRHKLERPSLLRLANGQVRAIRDGPSQVRGLRRRFVRCRRLKADQRRRSRFGPTT
jgi:hypothetical protein